MTAQSRHYSTTLSIAGIFIDVPILQIMMLNQVLAVVKMEEVMWERLKCLFLGLALPFAFGLLRYSINQGNYHKNEILFILVCILFLLLSVRYAQKMNVVTFQKITPKQFFQALVCLTIIIVFFYVYLNLFKVSSDASISTHARRIDGYSPSLILSISFLAPIEEELCLRGFVQKGVFQHSWLGMILTAALFSLFHGSHNMASFGYYTINGLFLGMAYKFSDNFMTPVLCHMGYNVFVIIMSLL